AFGSRLAVKSRRWLGINVPTTQACAVWPDPSAELREAGDTEQNLVLEDCTASVDHTELLQMHGLLAADVSALADAIPSLQPHAKMLSQRCLFGLPVEMVHTGCAVLRLALSADMLVQLHDQSQLLETMRREEDVMLSARHWDKVAEISAGRSLDHAHCAWEEFVCWLRLSPVEVQRHQTTVNELWAKLQELNISDAKWSNPYEPITFQTVHVAGSVAKLTASRLSFDVDLTFVTADRRPLSVLRKIFLTQCRACLAKVEGVQIQQEKPGAIAVGIIYNGLVLDLLIGRDLAAQKETVHHIELQPKMTPLEESKVRDKHRQFLQLVLMEMADAEAKMCIATYGRMAVLYAQQYPQVVRDCVLLLKAWRHGLMMDHFRELLETNMPDMRVTDCQQNEDVFGMLLQLRFIACAEVAPSCFLEQLAMWTYGEMERSASDFQGGLPGAVLLFQQVMLMMADLDVHSPSPKVLVPYRTEFLIRDWAYLEASMCADAAQNDRPVVMWNPFNARDDMARKVSAEAWKRMKTAAARAVDALNTSTSQVEQLAQVMHPFVRDKFLRFLDAGTTSAWSVLDPPRRVDHDCTAPVTELVPVPVPVVVPVAVPVPVPVPTPATAQSHGVYRRVMGLLSLLVTRSLQSPGVARPVPVTMGGIAAAVAWAEERQDLSYAYAAAECG
ncbi:unnamed protein product, partial [Symbiodinium necroappetens]